MKASPLVLVVATFAVASGCEAEAPKPLCDRSQPATGRVAVELGGVRFGPGEAVLYDNGALYLFVDDECRYWVNHPEQIWEETRSGVLDPATALRLGDKLQFNAWDDLSGVWSDSTGGVFDAPVLIFDHAMHAVVCADLCDSADVPVAVKTMRDEYPGVMQELWDGGVASVSSVRAIAVPVEPGPGMPFVTWPLARPISDFVRTDLSIEIGEGILEEDIASVAALKELRASFVRGDHGAFVWNALPVQSEGSHYLLYMRDTLPFEDARGLVPLSADADML